MQSEDHASYDKAIARLNRLAGWAWLALFFERLWWRLWLPVGVILLFLSCSWLGLWSRLPVTGHVAFLALFALALLYSCKGFLSLRRPDIREALRRIDLDSRLPHGEAEAMDDRLAIGRKEPATRTLWLMHRQRAARSIAEMRVDLPNPDMPRRDRYAIRSGLILVAVASAFIAGPEKAERLADAFRIQSWGTNREVAELLAGSWINPPAYTNLPPQIISFTSDKQHVRVPAGSVLFMRSGKGSGVSITSEPPLPETEPPPEPGTSRSTLDQRSYLLNRDSTVTLKTGWFSRRELAVSVIPDQPPTIELNGDITVNYRGSFVLPYRALDDYGITEVKALFSIAPPYRSLVPAPEIVLQPPPRGKAEQEMRQTIDLAEHPWAGLTVSVTLIARDAAGQEGRSAPHRMLLPQRPLTVPLARALAEQRRVLVVEPDKVRLVATALDGFLTAPELFTPEAGIFLGLRHARRLIRTLTDEADQLVLADWLWTMAVQIEDGSLSDAERELRAAQNRLQEAIARGADQNEIDRLSRDMREAMNRYMRELATRMAKNRNDGTVPMQSGQVITSDQLSQMLDRFEELMRQGRAAEAQQLLEQLRGVFDNMRTASPNGGQMDPMMREMMQALGETNNLLSEQQKLRDETYEKNRRKQLYSDQPQQDGEPGLKGMQPRQKDLRQRLEELKREGRGLGLEPDESLDTAEEAMREAEKALGAGDGTGAVDAQGRAIEALQRGSQNMMQQAQRMFGDNPAMGAMPNGRPGGFQNPFDGKANTKNVREKIEELIEQLRNKLADPSRPKDELDYFERLLRQ